MPIDKENMLAVLESFGDQCKDALTLAQGATVPKNVNKIIVTGMGGSAIGGDLLRSYMQGSGIPVFVNRNYQLPDFVDSSTLVFAASYSGNTEETLSAVADAQKQKAKIIGITSGGKLEKEVSNIIKIPKGIQPRAALAYLFFPMLGILYNSHLVDVKNKDLNEMLSQIAYKDFFKNEGKRIAKLIKDKVPIIYSSELLSPISYRFKTQINENAKYPAFCSVFPEMNHNEINGFKFIDRKKFIAFFIRDHFDNPRIRKRMDICSEIISERIDVEDILTKGESLIARMFSTIHLLDLASYELALINRVDPTPVEVIERLKKKLV